MKRPAIILPVVLVVIGILALTMAGFVFFVRAESTGVHAAGEAMQARLAAEGGFENFLAVIRKDRHNFAAYYDNPTQLRNILVWSEAYDRPGDPVRELGSRKEYFARTPTPPSAWRASVVAPRLDGPAGAIRFGCTPESAKLNINSASDLQIESLLAPLIRDMGVENAQQIVNAILDWRDADNDPRDGGAENQHYNSLAPAYNAKNGPLDTVEELLLVKGVTAAILYGEDANRNGVLDANEDDGEAADPAYDNGDGVLNLGIAPFLTVFAREVDTALDNKPRINLATGGGTVAAQIAERITDDQLSPETIAFISNLQGSGISSAVLRSPADLLAPGTDESIEDFAPPARPASQPATSQPQQSQGETTERTPSTGDRSGDRSGDSNGRDASARDEESEKKDEQQRKSLDGVKSDDRMQKADPQETPETDGTPGKSPTGGEGGRGPAQIGGGDRGPRAGQDGTAGRNGAGDGRGGGGGRGGRGGRGQGGQRSPQQQLQATFDALKNSPVKLEELPVLMDRFSTRRSQQTGGVMFGLVNINAAPLRVLQVVPGMTAEAASAIVGARQGLAPELLMTTAWPLVTGAVDAKTFKKIAPYITTKAYQYHVEVVGYADHSKVARRLEWVIEMIGPMAQVKYHRDLTSLGMGWPVDQDTVIVSK